MLPQILAACLAETNRLVFHAFDPAGSVTFQAAVGVLDRVWPSHVLDLSAQTLVTNLHALRYQWGTSDGN
jgi:hypothetical protein